MPQYKDEARGTWYFKTWYKDSFGRSKQKLIRGFKTKREAKEAEANFISQKKINLALRLHLILFLHITFVIKHLLKNNKKKNQRI